LTITTLLDEKKKKKEEGGKGHALCSTSKCSRSTWGEGRL
jgi:hypothetical protein